MRRATRVFLFLLLSAGVVPAHASAASWSPPVNVSTSSTFVEGPFIGYDRSGAGLAAWGWQDGVGRRARLGVRFSSQNASGTFSASRDAPLGLGGFAVYGSGRALMVGEEGVGRRRPSLSRIRIAFGRTDGRFGRPQTIDTVQTFRSPAAAVNDSGQVAVAYIDVRRNQARRAVKLAVRHGKRFGRPRVVSGRGANAVAVAVGPRGDLVVAWERAGRIEARIGTRRGRLGRVLSVGKGAKVGTALRAAVAANGRAWIAWTSQARSEGGDIGPFSIQSAVSAATRPGFRRARRLDSYDRPASDEARFDLALDPKGNGFVAWSTFDGANLRARLGSATRTGRFIRFGTLSQPGYDAVVSDLATSGRVGEALVVWARLDAVGEVGTQVLAGHQPPGGAFLGEEPVSSGDRARAPAAAFNPRTGAPTVVWSQREGPDGSGVPLSQVRTFLRASTRTP